MLPDIGGTELLLIAVVALLVVGPKDLPKMLRSLGQFMARLRNMAADFRASFDDMARQSELDELRQQVEALRRGEVDSLVGEATESVRQIEQTLSEVGVELNPGYPDYHEIVPDPASAEPAPKPPRVRKASGAARPKTAAKPKAAGSKPSGAAAAKGKAPRRSPRGGAKAKA